MDMFKNCIGIEFCGERKRSRKELGCFYMSMGIYADYVLENTSLDVYVKKVY
jgi:hypothetical protein